jgi:hypothetical protein
LKCGLQKSIQRIFGCASFGRKIRATACSSQVGAEAAFDEASRSKPGERVCEASFLACTTLEGSVDPRWKSAEHGHDGRRSRPSSALVPNPDDVGAVLVERVNARHWIGRVSDGSGVASQPASGVEPFGGARATTRNVRDRQTTVKAPPAGTVRGVGVGDHDKWPRWRAIGTSVEAGTSQHLVHQRRVEPARTARAWTAEPTF